MFENEIQFAALPSNEDIALWEREAVAEESDLREFDRELG
jgi:hypothetical protein